MLLDSLDTESALQRLHRQLAEMLHPAFELTAEEFSPLLKTYHDLLRAGHQFEPFTIALMLVLERQARDGETDGDSDAADFDLDRDDREEDYNECPATSYSVNRTMTSDECLTDMLERRADERRWG